MASRGNSKRYREIALRGEGVGGDEDEDERLHGELPVLDTDPDLNVTGLVDIGCCWTMASADADEIEDESARTPNRFEFTTLVEETAAATTASLALWAPTPPPRPAEILRPRGMKVKGGMPIPLRKG